MNTLRHREGSDFAWEVLRRCMRLRLRTALLFCLPAALLVGWYVWRVQTSLSGYSAALGKQSSLTANDYQLLLHDILFRDLRIVLMDRGSPPKGLKQFEFALRRRQRAALVESAKKDGKRPYIAATMLIDGQSQPVEVQLRGDQPWHVLGASRSMRIRLPPGQLYDGHRVFNLINDPSPFVVGEQVVLEIARELNVLTPRTSFARASMNGRDLGVFHYETQPDESLLRMWRRIPGSMYSGDLKRGVETQALWTDSSKWKKHAWRVPEEKDSRHELERLLAMVSTSTVAEFTDFARHEVDMSAFAQFEAIDIAFGSKQRDFRHNHRLYFDPYRGRWQPVAWSFRAFKHEPEFNLADNPILMRLKQLPEYPSLLATMLYSLLTQEGSVGAVRQRSIQTLERLAPELRSDHDWYAHKLLPRLDAFHRRMLRPMTLDRAALIMASEIETYAVRHAFLMRELTSNPLTIALATARPNQDDTPLHVQRVQLRLLGRSGVRVERVRVTPAPDCQDVVWTLRSDDRVLVHNVTTSEASLPIAVEFYPAFGAISRADVADDNGGIRFLPVMAVHDLRLESTCPVSAMSVFGTQLSNRALVQTQASNEEMDDWPQPMQLGDNAVPTFEAEEPPYVAAPRWLAAPVTHPLGPGIVEVPHTVVFGSDKVVEIAAGTRLKMGLGASLVFLGRVRILGTKAEPVVIEPRGDGAWGGVAIQGPGTAGSELEHVSMRGGTAAAWRQVTFPATLSIHDTRDIALRSCNLENNGEKRDMLHAAYVNGLSVIDTKVSNAAVDGMDLEFTTATLRRVEVTSVGDDAVDLMGSKVQLHDALLVGGRGNGLSAGERSRVRSTHLFIGGFEVGVLAKNASEVQLGGTLLYRNQAGVRVYQKESRFAGASEVYADELFAVDCEKSVRLDRKSDSSVRLNHIRTSLPVDGSLDFLRDRVLGIDAWTKLPEWVTARGGGS